MKDYLIYSLEDDQNISHIINLALTKSGYNIVSFYDYDSFYNEFKKVKPNMILLDLMLPKISGETILKEIRSDKSNDDIKIIIISAKNLTINKIDGLDLGADDYIAKPFDVLELISRVNAHSRRYLNKLNEELVFKSLKIDNLKKEVSINNEIIKLTNSEFKILEYLLKNKDRVVTKDELYTLLWGKDESFESRVLDVHIKEIRKKLEPYKEVEIETLYGVGYRLK